MAKQTQPVDYQTLTVTTIKAKFGFLLLGIVVFLGILGSVSYTFAQFSKQLTQSQPLNQKSTTKTKPNPKFPTTYVVQDGDTLASISIKLYGTDVYNEDIMKANNLYTPESLEVGKILIIPLVTPKSATQGQIGQGAMTGQVTVTGTSYTVQAGESLSDIALKIYGDSNAWIKIAQANGITDPNVVVEGLTLKIPH